ncbi:hypothetical protein C8R44DRAFT_871010 [Mycena epipterygia]|nr:hypothetical protein C8R44DRAFT_871010 [Mycena epipterygia]
MNLFHNAVGSVKLTNVVVGTTQQVAFGRGSIGFLVINNDATTWSYTWNTSLPAGTSTTPIANPKTCAGMTHEVSSSGTFTGSVPAFDALALYSTGSSAVKSVVLVDSTATSSSTAASSSTATSSSTASSTVVSAAASSSVKSVPLSDHQNAGGPSWSHKGHGRRA